MGRSYYFRRVRVIVGMTVVGAVIVPLALPLNSCPVGLVQYAYKVIDWPTADEVVEIEYEPLVVRMEHCVVEVGTVADVEMHASPTLPPFASLTRPVIVTGVLVADATGVGVTTGVGDTVRAGLGDAVRVAAGDAGDGSCTAGTPEADCNGDADGELAAGGVAEGDGTTTGTWVSMRGTLAPSRAVDAARNTAPTSAKAPRGSRSGLSGAAVSAAPP